MEDFFKTIWVVLKKNEQDKTLKGPSNKEQGLFLQRIISLTSYV